MKVFIWGMGNVGLGLALALQRSGVQVVGAFNRGSARAAVARAQLGDWVQSGTAPSASSLQAASLVLAAVSDDALHEVGAQLAEVPWRAGTVVAHLSGCLPAAHLPPQGVAERGSLHPLLACPEPLQASTELPHALYTVEGAPPARAVLSALVQHLGGRVCMIDSDAKARYHAAAVMASNLMVALLDVAVGEAQAAGLDDAPGALSAFARQAVDNACKLGPLRALTGPALRGDAQTLRRHAAALGQEALPIYRLLSEHAVGMAGHRGLSPTGQDVLKRLLASNEFASSG